MDLTNNLRAQNAIGSLAAVGIGTGRFEVNGAISLYFEDATEYNKFVNEWEIHMEKEYRENGYHSRENRVKGAFTSVRGKGV